MASRGHPEYGQVLSDRDVDPNAGYNYNQSLLRCASGTVYPEVARVVLDHGADANSCAKDNENLLHLASQCHASIVGARSEEHDVIITARHLYSTRDSDQLPKACIHVIDEKKHEKKVVGSI
jgi:hypothetical protein